METVLERIIAATANLTLPGALVLCTLIVGGAYVIGKVFG